MANKLFSFKIFEQMCTVPGITFIASQMIDQPEDEHSDATCQYYKAPIMNNIIVIYLNVNMNFVGLL